MLRVGKKYNMGGILFGKFKKNKRLNNASFN